MSDEIEMSEEGREVQTDSFANKESSANYPQNESSSLLKSENIKLESNVQEQHGFFLYIITAFAVVGGFLFGGAILFLQEDHYLSKDKQWDVELFVSIALAGAVIGSFVGGPLSDRFGRKPIIICASLLFATGSLILGFALELIMLFVGRFIVGTGIGVAATIVPIYIAEVAPARYRGSLVTVNNLCITGGQFISYLVDAGFIHVPHGWRYMLGLAVVPAIIQIIGMLFIVPESKKRESEGIEILQRIRGAKSNIEVEVEEIKQSLTEESGTFSELFSANLRPALIIGTSLQFFQQTCGINTAMYYSATLLKMAGYESNSAAVWFSVAVAGTNAFFTLIAIWLIDRTGRRKLLLGSMIGMIFGLVFLGTSFYFQDRYPKYVAPSALGSLMFYVAFFALGMGPVPWAVNSEIYPTRVRGLANGLATTVNWASNLVVSMSFLSYIKLVKQYGAFWTYAGIGIIAWIFFFFALPETKGKSVEQIEQDLRKHK